MPVLIGLFGALFALMFVVVVFAIVIALLQWLWNITMPEVFGLNQITYWQAFRLILIASILFGGPSAAITA